MRLQDDDIIHVWRFCLQQGLAIADVHARSAGWCVAPTNFTGVQVTACSRQRLRNNYHGALLATSTGALAWLQPLPGAHHALLKALCVALYTCLAHTAGLNPKRHRMPASNGPAALAYGQRPPEEGVLDGELLWEYTQLSRAAQERVALHAGVSSVEALAALQDAALAATYF